MTPEADPLVLDFVEWIAHGPRAHADVIEAWRTSCPRLTVWEDASEAGYVTRMPCDKGSMIAVTEEGRQLLRAHGRSDSRAGD